MKYTIKTIYEDGIMRKRFYQDGLCFKYKTFALYKSAVHKQNKDAVTRKRLAQKLRNERLGRRLAQGMG